MQPPVAAQAGLTDWAKVFDQELIFRDRCWEQCGGGYCCKPTRVQRQFSLLRSKGVELPLLPGELAFLQGAGLLQRGFEGDLTRHEVRAGKISFPVFRTVCNLDGICSDHRYRPIVCRIYPWAPVPDVSGRVLSLEPVAVIDQFWDLIEGGQNPCVVGDLTDEEMVRYQQVVAEIFRDPVNIFYLGAASIFKRAIREGVKAAPARVRQLPQEQFFATWEKLLVFGQLYKAEAVLADIEAWHDALKAHWGEGFSLSLKPAP